MDQHVPQVITTGLRIRGVDVQTAFEDRSHEFDDEKLLVRANSLGRILFTQDDDLLAIAQRWQRDGNLFAGLVYGHQLKLPIGRAVADLEILMNCVTAEEFQNRVEFIPL